MSGGLPDVQGAIYRALVNAGVCGGRITDDPQSDAATTPTAFPYVEIGESIADNTPITGKNDGTDEIMLLSVWSRYNGMKELKTEVGKLRAALDGIAFNASGRVDCIAYVLDETSRREADGITRRCIVRVQVTHFG